MEVIQVTGNDNVVEVIRKSTDKQGSTIVTTTHNAFEVLGELDGEGIQIGHVVCAKVGKNGNGGGNSTRPDG